MRRLPPLLLLVAAIATTAHAQSVKPGLWEITTQMSGAGMPAMPAIPEAQRKQMEAMGIALPNAAGGPMVVTVKSCLTPEQAEKRLPPQTDEDRRNRCEQKDVKTSGKTTSWKLECTGAQKMSGSGTLTFVSPEAYQGEMTLVTQDARRGAVTMQQQYRGKWLAAACK